MIPKEKMFSLCTLAASLLLLLIGGCGLIFERYPIPPIPSEYRFGVTGGDASLLLSVLTLLMAAALAIPHLIKLKGGKVRPFRGLYLAIQCCIVAAIVVIFIEAQTSNSVDTAFVQYFQDLNRSGDDNVAGVAFDSKLQMLVVGRESGRVEFWNTYSPGTRFVHDAHMARAQFIAFGQEDGIVLTGSPFDNAKLQPGSGPHVWDAATGKLLVILPGFWAPGPMVASPVRGMYVIADSSTLRLYDHHQRKLVGDAYTLENGAQVTAIASDAKSGLIAVGSSNGELQLLTLNAAMDQPSFKRVRQIAPYGKGVGLDVLTLKFLQEGKRLVSVGWLPEALREQSQAEISEWNTDTFQRQRTYPFSLQTVNWAAAVPDEHWLILAGLESSRGKIELVNLQTGIAWRYKANTSHPRAVLLPSVNAGLILQSGRATKINYLDAQ